MANKALIEMATRHAIYLESLKAHNLKDYDAFLKDMAKIIKARLGGENLTAFARDRLERTLELVAADLRTITNQASKTLRDQATDLAAYEAGFELKSLSGLTQAEFVLPTAAQLAAAVLYTPLAQIQGAAGSMNLEAAMKRWGDDVIAQVQSAIQGGYYRGETTDQIIRSLLGTVKGRYTDGELARVKRDLESVVRTGLQHAANQARNQVWANNADIVRKWRFVATLDLKTTSQCFPASVEVSPASVFENIFRANYTGDMVIVTTSAGKKLEGTPNHPVLTTRGFLPIHELKEGDKVISPVFFKVSEINGDKDVCVPSRIGELFDSINEPSIVNVISKRASAIDFYGDGTGMNGEIDILPIESHLRSDDISSVNKNIVNKMFGLIHQSDFFSADGSGYSLIFGHNPADMPPEINVRFVKDAVNGASGSSCDGHNIAWLLSFVEQLDDSDSVSYDAIISLAALADWHDSISFQETCYGGSGGVESLAKPGSGLTISVTVDNVVSVMSEFKSCHVYTLSDNLGFYIASGMIVKNCRALDKTTWPLGQGPLPPLHYRCRSTSVAKLDDAFDMLEEGAERMARDPNTGKSGLVDNKLSYYDWLKRQDLPYVQSVLGKDRAALLLKGGLSAERFAALQLDRQFQPMSLAKIARLDEQFIHAAFRKAGLSRYL